MGAMQRRKGKAFERTVANLFKPVFPTAKRTLTQQRDSGEAPDIEAPGWWVEAKAHKRVNIQKAFAQAVNEVARAKSALTPVAVTKDNKAEIMATLRLKDFLRLVAAAEQHKAEEREACAKVADDYKVSCGAAYGASLEIAAAIRNRGAT